MRMVLVDSGTQEWQYMWAELSSYVASEHIGQYGETWQYMGSEVHENGNCAHVFRHRDYFDARKYARVSASQVFNFAMRVMA